MAQPGTSPHQGLVARPSTAALIGPLVLAGLPFILFAPVTFMSRVFSAQDLQAYFYPYHVLPARMIAEGHLPLWNPYVFSGIPLLGDGQTAMFYPPNWLFFLLPGETALNIVVLLQFSIAGVGMFAFARTIGLWRVPAFVAALAYMFSGAVTARVVHLSIMSGAALLPAILACVERLLASRGRGAMRWCVLTAVALACQATAGHPQVPIYTALAVAIVTAVRAAELRTGLEGWRRVRTAALLVAAAYGLGYALAAVQLVPWIEFARLSTRAAGTPYDFVFRTSSSGADWLLFLFPYLLGAHEGSVFATGPLPIEQAVRVWEHSAYVGMLPLALAVAGIAHLAELTHRRRDHTRADVPEGVMSYSSPRHRCFPLLYLVLLLGAGVLIAAGWHTPFSRILYLVPALGKLRAVERALVLAAFALAALAGFGMQRSVEAPRGRGWLLIPAFLIVAVPLGLVTAAYVAPAASLPSSSALGRLSLRLPHTFLPVLLAAISALLLAWWSRAAPGLLTQAIAIAVVVGDLGLYATSFTPTQPRRLYRARPPVLDALQEDGTPFRKATVLMGTNDLGYRAAQHTLAMSWGMVYGIEDVNGFNSLQPRRYTDYVFGPRVDDVSYGYLRDVRLFRADSPVLPSLNVRYVLVPAGDRIPAASHLRPIFEGMRVRVYENTLAYPRAYFADHVRGETSRGRVLTRVTAPGFDGRREALVESGSPPSLPDASGPAVATVRCPGPNDLIVNTVTTEPRFLVVSEMYFPGWRAYVDGVETPIYRTNYLFRGVVVPAGRHAATFAYRPVSVLIGAGITTVAGLAVGFLVARGRRA